MNALCVGDHAMIEMVDGKDLRMKYGTPGLQCARCKSVWCTTCKHWHLPENQHSIGAAVYTAKETEDEA